MKNKMKMSNRLVCVFLVIMLFLTVGVESVLYFQNKERIENETTTTMLHINDALTTQMDSVLHTMDSTAIQLINDASLASQWQNYAQGINTDASKSYLKSKLINELRNNSMIRRLVIYDQKGNCFYTGSFDADRNKVKQRADSLVKMYDFTGAYTRVLIAQDKDYWYSINTSQVVTLIRPLIFNEENYSFIEVDVKAAYMNFFCEEADYDGITTQNLVLWGDKNEYFVNDYHEDDLTHEDFVDVSRVYQRIQEKNNCLIAVGRSSYYDCKLLTILNKNYISSELNKLLYSTLGAILAFVCLGIVFFVCVINSQLYPLRQLTKDMENFQLDTQHTLIEINPKDYETEVLLHTYKSMITRLYDNMEKMKQMKDIQSSTLFSILQREIKPHFLYNTLGAIAYLCEAGENQEAIKACFDLTDILRYASDYATTSVEVSDEVKNLEAYLSVMKYRYRERLVFDIRCDETAYGYTLPKLTLQPLVENAIQYSLLEQDVVNVQVDIREINDALCIEIADNGCGMSQEKIHKIRNDFFAYSEESQFEELCKKIQFGNMGLVGTLARLKILFKKGFAFEIIGHNEQNGTTIILFVGE